MGEVGKGQMEHRRKFTTSDTSVVCQKSGEGRRRRERGREGGVQREVEEEETVEK